MHMQVGNVSTVSDHVSFSQAAHTSPPRTNVHLLYPVHNAHMCSAIALNRHLVLSTMAFDKHGCNRFFVVRVIIIATSVKDDLFMWFQRHIHEPRVPNLHLNRAQRLAVNKIMNGLDIRHVVATASHVVSSTSCARCPAEIQPASAPLHDDTTLAASSYSVGKTRSPIHRDGALFKL